MKYLVAVPIVFLASLLYSATALSQSAVPDTYINHAWVQGVYWDPVALPSWGFLIDAQEETLFGAVYGYDGGDATFITLIGTIVVGDPLEYRGDVFSISNNGSTVRDVGNFTWRVGQVGAAPAATLTISSNILNFSNLQLVRFSYVEDDKVDMLTGGAWNIVRRILSSTFGDHYSISDDRLEDDGITFATILDNSALGNIGVVAYFPLGRGDNYAMLLDFLDDTDVFYVFFASDTDMYGRYWLLDEGESLTGDGNYFHGNADTGQFANPVSGTTAAIASIETSVTSQSSANLLSELRSIERSGFKNLGEQLGPMFSKSAVQSVYEVLLKKHLANQSAALNDSVD